MPDWETKLGNHTGEQWWEAIKNVMHHRFDLRKISVSIEEARSREACPRREDLCIGAIEVARS